ncbi:patatin-like phospholipase family protein [Actinomadura parmotrematis]|uniref:Patatin-like phospholipase family protein n=1 Tax=Actinomadura parmotrematis TaxID=2864039 RepID=A0ABS7G2B8_9ACTN|nr:patatin-like phospholipase family protein [Actinomadura parmotrematis]MBW8486862.1 patatin-like phospholipase family protein [Actinomadura parmotrematis]
MAGQSRTAFVLGGGGVLGAHEVGMLRALHECGVRPDLVVGTSIGAMNGAAVAADPDRAVERLTRLWSSDSVQEALGARVWERLWTLARSGTHLHSAEPLERMLRHVLPVETFEKLELPFQCVAASIEKAQAHWFSSGPLIPAVLASSAAPGMLPPVRIGDEHFLDGGLVHSIPVGRAIELGADTIYVLHVGRIDRDLAPPRRPWEVGMVAFEIARRHRFFEEMANLPGDVTVHVMPAGGPPKKAGVDLAQVRYRNAANIAGHVEGAYQASLQYLKERT